MHRSYSTACVILFNLRDGSKSNVTSEVLLVLHVSSIPSNVSRIRYMILYKYLYFVMHFHENVFMVMWSVCVGVSPRSATQGTVRTITSVSAMKP